MWAGRSIRPGPWRCLAGSRLWRPSCPLADSPWSLRNPRNVIVIRHLNGKRYGTSLDLGKALEGKATEPFYLEPHDIIWVPKTLIANANQWIDQHINKMIPELGLSYSFPHGSGTLTLDATQVGR